ncbi:MAG: PulJ/GspJ family protein [Planctomycetota bacterium]
MRGKRTTFGARGFTLVELMMVVAIVALMVAAVLTILVSAQRNMRSEVAHHAVEGTATTVIDAIGKDVRESSYAYTFAGDWLAVRPVGAPVSINVARNYFSASPGLGGGALAPGLTGELGAQCPNPACTWCNHVEGAGLVMTVPHAFLARPARNNPQSGAPTNPPPAFAFSPADAKGRLFGHRAPGDACPFCSTALVDEAFFGGLLLFSPRAADRTFSYGGATGYEAQWESMIFYCPWRNPNTGNYELRRYAFFASLFTGGGPPANLIDLLDFDGNGVIESPPMTDTNGNFVLDADGERFCLVPGASGNDLLYTRWDASTGRSFRIQIDRTTAVATVTVGGGPFAGGLVRPLEMRRFGLGLSDFDASTFINNPSWTAGGPPVNPTGVAEPGIVRITLQVDRPGNPTRGNLMDREETVQTTALRPRN